ncbi:hypothetical protein BH739_04670 [Enterococcus casseliflavus]|nr:hypothetical protein BH739_04670 [Enterococcus casseliflavus]
MVKKSIEEKLAATQAEVQKIEKRILADQERLRKKQEELKQLEIEATMAVIKEYDFNSEELRAFLKKNTKGTSQSIITTDAKKEL